VVGAGGHAAACLDVLSANQISICSHWISSNEQEFQGPATNELVQTRLSSQTDIPRSKTLNHFDNHGWVVAVGDGVARRHLVAQVRQQFASPKFPALVSKKASVSKEALIGEGVQILDGAHVGPQSRVGDFSIINSNAILEHHAGLGSFSHLAPGSAVLGAATVGDSCLVGANAVVGPKVCLGNKSVLGALSFHSKSSSQPGLFVGAPSIRQLPRD
jgi:sugar O-acyltransferase (sialic acid O-acetyltransferase NeuD family)